MRHPSAQSWLRSFRAIATALCSAAILSSASAAALHAQNASLAGSVLTDVGDKPIPNALITITDLSLATRADSLGKFLITGIKPGKHTVVVRQLGFDPINTSMTFGNGQRVEADFALVLPPTRLSTVDVKGKQALRLKMRLDEFNDDMKGGMGHYLTSDLFDKNASSNMSQLLMRNLAGISTFGMGSKQVVVSHQSGTYKCYVQIILNGLPVYNGSDSQDPFDMNAVFAGDVIGVEYYTPATTPLRFNNAAAQSNKGSACGTLLLWTK